MHLRSGVGLVSALCLGAPTGAAVAAEVDAGTPPGGVDGPATPDRASLRAAVARALPLLEGAAVRYTENKSCFSCHHQTLPALALVTARERGFALDEAWLRDQAAFTHESFAGRIEEMREGRGVGGESMNVAYALWMLALADHPRDETTEAMATFLLVRQEEDGRWHRTTHRPPLEESDSFATHLATHRLARFAPPGRESDVHAAIAAADAWQRATTPRSQEDFNAGLWWRAVRTGTPPEESAAARQAVLARQRTDGGWAQLDGMESDAYATGQTLFILMESGMPADDPRIARGLRRLLATQRDDGSWFVETRSKPIQRYFDNGDPHGKDQFISTPASAWAAAALARALPREHPEDSADASPPAQEPGPRSPPGSGAPASP